VKFDLQGRVGEIVSFNRNPQADALKVQVYGTLANFWLELGTKGEMGEDEAVVLLQLQQALIQECERKLAPYSSEDEMGAFREYVDKFKVRIMFFPDKSKVHYRR
jgi:hypothetical protein